MTELLPHGDDEVHVAHSDVKLAAIPHEGVARLDVVPEEYHDYLWGLYEASFAELQEKTPTLQLMHEDDFRKSLTDPRVTKMFSFTDGRPETMLIYSSIKLSPEYYPWNSVPYFEKNFQEDFAADRIYYFVGLFTDPEYQNRGNFIRLVEPLFRDVMERDPLGARFIYDCCEDNAWLAQVLHSLAERHQSGIPDERAWRVAELAQLGTQTYYDIDMKQ
jgi:hypothetical protein